VTQIAAHRARTTTVETDEGTVALLDTGDQDTGDQDTGDQDTSDQDTSDRAPPPPALLVPGYTGSKEDFAPVLDGLAVGGRRVVAMDLPGQYQSPGPDDAAAYSVGWLATVVRAVAGWLGKEAGGGSVHLLGHSFGGLVARDAVIADPATFASLVLLSSGPAAIGGPRKDRVAALEPLLHHGGMPAVYEAVERLAQVDPRYAAAPVALKAFLRERFLASTAAGLKGMGDALLAEPDRVKELAASGVPVLVCYGEHDDAWQPSTQARMAERLGARRAVIGGAVHSPAVEQPATMVAVLSAFWAEHDAD